MDETRPDSETLISIPRVVVVAILFYLLALTAHLYAPHLGPAKLPHHLPATVQTSQIRATDTARRVRDDRH